MQLTHRHHAEGEPEAVERAAIDRQRPLIDVRRVSYRHPLKIKHLATICVTYNTFICVTYSKRNRENASDSIAALRTRARVHGAARQIPRPVHGAPGGAPSTGPLH